MSKNGGLWFGAILMASCAGYETHQKNLTQAKLDQAEEVIGDLKAKTANLAEASDDLKREVDRFSTENWREVVPDAQQAAEEADSAKEEATQAADSADADRDD